MSYVAWIRIVRRAAVAVAAAALHLISGAARGEVRHGSAEAGAVVQVGAVLPVFDLYTTAAPPPVGVGPILGVALLSSPVADSLQLVASLDGSFLAMVGARRLVVGGIVGGRVHPFAGRGWYAQAGLGVVVTREWIAMDVGPRSFRSRDGGAGLAGDAVVGWSADRFEVSIAWRQRLASSFEGAAQGALALRLGWLL